MGELVSRRRVQDSWLHPLPAAALGELAGQCWRASLGGVGAGRLNTSTTTQAKIQGFELAQPIYELLECMKESVLQNQNFEISMTPATIGYEKSHVRIPH